jgi:hypothetical protein
MDGRRRRTVLLPDRPSRRCQGRVGLGPELICRQAQKAWDEAVAKGWTIVSMKGDWKRIFPK